MNRPMIITKTQSKDLRFNLSKGAGSDAIHTNPIYSYAVCYLHTKGPEKGTGLAFTLGTGNDLVCKAIDYLSKYIVNREIDELMDNFGSVYKQMADDSTLRWLGPHKGVVHLALASIVNACFDLWAKKKGVPLWKLLIDLPPEKLVRTLDFSYCEEVLTAEEALDIINQKHETQNERIGIVDKGYRGYDTSVGWINYSDKKVKENIKKAIDNGFTAMKLKVGSKESSRDLRRAEMLRKTAGDNATLMFDANQQWGLGKAIFMCNELKNLNPYWVEEPTHPDDVLAHVKLKEETGVPLAMGEHIPNKIMFKNFLQSGSMSFNQVDAVRVGGVSEFILTSLLSQKFDVPVIPHVGDMGQIHQHLVLFNHISLGNPALFLEYIPHLKDCFKHPVIIENGYYKTPQEPGMSTDFK